LKREDEHIDDLLGKYLTGEASEDENSLVLKWVEESEENRKYFEQIRKIFEGASAIRERREYDTDAAWNKLKQNLHRGGRVVDIRQRSGGLQWWKIAAAIVLVALVGIYLFIPSATELKPVQVVAGSRAVSDTLPDGTDIFLNRKSKIEYAFDQKKKQHEVKLEGEAYFNVMHENDEVFIIRAGEVFIRDIGTSFNVKAYPDSDLIEVLVEEGEIVFYSADNPGIRLKESGKGVYDKKTKKFTIDQPDPNITAYKTKFFIFSDTRLGEVVRALNEVYETPVIIDEALQNCPITVSFRNEPIEEIAAVIAETLSLTVEKEPNGIHLKGHGCE
jgi:ferric-dicitrate binding protein FerR (iron transport regulator)